MMANTFANTPVCCPARALLLTGQYCHRNGIVANDLRLRESRNGMAKVFAAAGYRTGFVGKWHLDGGLREPGFVPPGPRRHGYEFWAAHECSHRHFDNHYFRDTADPIRFNKFETEGWTDVGVEFLEECKNDDRPFYLTIQVGPPHDPYKSPPEFMTGYSADSLKMRPNWQKRDNVPGPEQIAHYYGMTTAVDQHVGRILRALDKYDLTEDTIVLFASDHGDMLGSHGYRLKRKPWEESIRVPGIIRYPKGIPENAISESLFSHIDFAPTLLSMCGIDVPKSMQGEDFSKVMLGGKDDGPDSVFCQIFGPYGPGEVEEGWRAVRTKQYLYARYQSRPWLLYDLKEDVFQQNNLVNDPAAKKLLKSMESKLERWMRKTGDSWSYNWSQRVEENGRLYKHRTFYSVQEYLAWAKEHPESGD